MSKKSTKLEELHHTFKELGISPETIETNDTLIRKIKKQADSVPDYRHPSYVRHLLNISCYEGHRYAFEIHQYT